MNYAFECVKSIKPYVGTCAAFSTRCVQIMSKEVMAKFSGKSFKGRICVHPVRGGLDTVRDILTEIQGFGPTDNNFIDKVDKAVDMMLGGGRLYYGTYFNGIGHYAYAVLYDDEHEDAIWQSEYGYAIT